MNLNERLLDLQTRSLRDNFKRNQQNTKRKLRGSSWRFFLKSEMDIMEEPQFQRVHRMGEICKGGIDQSKQNLSYTKKKKSQKSCSVQPCLKAILEITNNFQRKLTTPENCQFLILNGQSTSERKIWWLQISFFVKGHESPLTSIHNQTPIQRTDPETVYGPRQFATRNANLTEYRPKTPT